MIVNFPQLIILTVMYYAKAEVNYLIIPPAINFAFATLISILQQIMLPINELELLILVLLSGLSHL